MSSTRQLGVDLLFDARHVRQSGIGTYIGILLPHLERIFAERGLSLAVLTDADTAPELSESTTVVTAAPAGASMYGLSEQKAWRNALRAVKPRAMWVPHYPFPLALLDPRNRSVTAFATVHDTLHLQEATLSGHNRARQFYARMMMALTARRCRTIFTPSAATATAFVREFPSANVMVTPIPADEVWFNPVRPELSPVAPSYILYIGNAKYHKNLPLLLKAYAEIAGSVSQKLVIAGAGHVVRNHDDRVGELAAQLGDRVHVLGRLDFEALRALVAGADLLVMPSLFEGAGLPPLEAMAAGTAVLSSGIPVLRETCGTGADYFDPYNASELAELLLKYCNDDAGRADLAARGYAHVQHRQTQISFGAAVQSVCDELAVRRR